MIGVKKLGKQGKAMAEWLVSGWEMYSFIVTPEEWERCLTGFRCVVYNAHVLLDYQETPMEEYLEPCRTLFTRLAAGERLIWKQDYSLLCTMGLTTDLARCGYGHIHDYQGQRFKRPDFDQPCVSAAPFTLYPMSSGEGKISVSTRVSYSQYPENVVGWQLCYPKKVCFKAPGTNTYGPAFSTKTLAAYQDFSRLKERIQKFTHPMLLNINGKKLRTRVRISEAAKASASQFYVFQQGEFSLIG